MDSIERLIDEAVEQQHLPALACAVVDASGAPRFITRGYADVERAIPMDEHSVMRVASISKTFTAIGLMQLWEQGRFDLDEPANRHLKAYQLSRDDVTFRHLLTHTAGIGELPSLRGLRRPGALGMIGAGRPQPTLRDMYGPVQRVGIRPGTKWAYANHGFATLGQLVEDISGRPFADRMRESLFEPLGMEHTDFVSARVSERLAVGYRFKHKAAVPVKFREMTTPGGGGLFSCAADMACYIQTLAGGGSPLLKSETLEAMLTPQYPRDGALPAVGLAFWLSEAAGRVVAGHGGDVPGFKSSMRFAPGGPGVFVSTNGGGAADMRLSLAIDGLTERVMAILLGHTVDHTPGPAACGADLVGFYRPDRGFLTNARTWALFGGEVEILQRDGALYVRTPWGVAFRALSLTAHGTRLKFEAAGLVGEFDVERDVEWRPIALHLRSNIGFATFRRVPSSLRRKVALVTGGLLAARVVRARRKTRTQPRGAPEALS